MQVIPIAQSSPYVEGRGRWVEGESTRFPTHRMNMEIGTGTGCDYLLIEICIRNFQLFEWQESCFWIQRREF